MKRLLAVLGFALLACVPSLALAADPDKPTPKPDLLPLKDGDRVVLLGNTLIEREQRYGYWEMALTTRFHDKHIQFRNLGWAGDTVWGEARAGFGTQVDGFKHLKEHVASIKPTVLLVGYGGNEAFAGATGLPHFVEGLEKLLDTLAEHKARIVLLSPLRQEDVGRPLPDPAEQNKNIELYRDAMGKVADQRGYLFVDLYELLPDSSKGKLPRLLTDNGIHLTPYGYFRSAFTLENGLGLPAKPWRIEVDADKKTAAGQGCQVVAPKENVLRFQVTDDSLPLALAEKDAGAAPTAAERILRVRGLPPGKYPLVLDGKEIVTATAQEWAEGVNLHSGPEFDQAEKLRATIREKNRLYFHSWRPQNETYLFGFRKHEQGQNAREIPQFDPLVVKQEEEIARLRVPIAHRYELKAQTVRGDKE